MSLGPRTMVGVSMYKADAAPKVGYTNGGDGAMSLCHVGIFSRACFGCRLSLLNSLCTRRGMTLKERLEQHEGHFLDFASTLFLVGGRSRIKELPEDNSLFAAVVWPDRLLAFILFNRGCRVATPSCVFTLIFFQTSP